VAAPPPAPQVLTAPVATPATVAQGRLVAPVGPGVQALTPPLPEAAEATEPTQAMAAPEATEVQVARPVPEEAQGPQESTAMAARRATAVPRAPVAKVAPAQRELKGLPTEETAATVARPAQLGLVVTAAQAAEYLDPAVAVVRQVQQAPAGMAEPAGIVPMALLRLRLEATQATVVTAVPPPMATQAMAVTAEPVVSDTRGVRLRSQPVQTVELAATGATVVTVEARRRDLPATVATQGAVGEAAAGKQARPAPRAATVAPAATQAAAVPGAVQLRSMATAAMAVTPAWAALVAPVATETPLRRAVVTEEMAPSQVLQA
jgi:hypothetical protein